MKINSIEEIGKEKLRELFRRRGHSVRHPSLIGTVEEILKGRHKGMEVHQCKCGELMTLSTYLAEILRKVFGTNEIPCKICGNYRHMALDMDILRRAKEVARFIDERSIFTTKSLSTLKPSDVETLTEMALGLFPTNTHAEMLVGYFDFINALMEYLPRRQVRYMPEVGKLFDKAKTMNPKEFDLLSDSVLDWRESHRANLNVSAQMELLESLSTNYRGFLKDELDDRKEIRSETTEIQLRLSAYKDAVEVRMYPDILANILSMVQGKATSTTPFKNLTLPPLKKKGKPRVIKSLADKVEYLQINLPFSIQDVYNTHLRNAVAHNEYEIRAGERRIVLTGYSEALTFSEFEKIFENLSDLRVAIDSYLANRHVQKLRLETGNQGIGGLTLGYTDFSLESGRIRPRAPCDAQLLIHQYWDFVTSEHGERVFPAFEMRIEKKDQTLVIDFGRNGAAYGFKKTSEAIEWLNQLIQTGRLQVSLVTVAPILPKFAEKAKGRTSVGRRMNVYFLDASEKVVDLSPDLINRITTFLGNSNTTDI